MKSIAIIAHNKNFPLEIYDSNGHLIYYEGAVRNWWKAEYDDNGNRLYIETAYGIILDSRE